MAQGTYPDVPIDVAKNRLGVTLTYLRYKLENNHGMEIPKGVTNAFGEIIYRLSHKSSDQQDDQQPEPGSGNGESVVIAKADLVIPSLDELDALQASLQAEVEIGIVPVNLQLSDPEMYRLTKRLSEMTVEQLISVGIILDQNDIEALLFIKEILAEQVPNVIEESERIDDTLMEKLITLADDPKERARAFTENEDNEDAKFILTRLGRLTDDGITEILSNS